MAKTKAEDMKLDVTKLDESALALREGLQTQAAGALMEIPDDFIDPDDQTGKEGIRGDELRLPRLAIAQGLSKQMIKSDPRYIKGLQAGELFNDLTGEVYGPGPLLFLPLVRKVHRLQFTEDGKGIARRDIPHGDKSLRWAFNPETGKDDLPPTATEFVDFVSALLIEGRDPEVVVISVKTTNKFQRQAAAALSTFLEMQKGPAFASFKTVEVREATFAKGAAGVFVFANVADGRLDAKPPKVTPEERVYRYQLYLQAKRMAEKFKTLDYVVEREAGEDDETSFDTAKMERETREGEVVGDDAPKM